MLENIGINPMWSKVVTEHGIVDLFGKTGRQRSRSLIIIAHPQFREELPKQAIEMHYL
ncbi:acetyl-CoA hydrolase/transferase C-terminal domain-containing protein [Chloroflexota bacterium]